MEASNISENVPLQEQYEKSGVTEICNEERIDQKIILMNLCDVMWPRPQKGSGN